MKRRLKKEEQIGFIAFFVVLLVINLFELIRKLQSNNGYVPSHDLSSILIVLSLPFVAGISTYLLMRFIFKNKK